MSARDDYPLHRQAIALSITDTDTQNRHVGGYNLVLYTMDIERWHTMCNELNQLRADVTQLRATITRHRTTHPAEPPAPAHHHPHNTK